MSLEFLILNKSRKLESAFSNFFLFLIAISALLYFYLVKEKPAATEPAPPVANVNIKKNKTPIKKIKKEETQKPIVAPATVESPKKSYMKAKVEFDGVANFNDFEQMILKYGSVNRIKEFTKEKKEVEGMPDSFKNNIVSLIIRQSMPKLSEIKDIKATIKGNTAILSAVTNDLSKKGTILMARENNVWKLDSEGWENVKAETKNTEMNPVKPAEFSNGLDSDKDGLTDKEENAIGSDSNNPDSDGDGYSDLSELLNLYNPDGEGKLEDSPAIKKYKNNNITD